MSPGEARRAANPSLGEALDQVELAAAEAECAGGAALGPPSIRRSNPRLHELPENITSMHDGFSRAVRQANMRLLRIAEEAPAPPSLAPMAAANLGAASKGVTLSGLQTLEARVRSECALGRFNTDRIIDGAMHRGTTDFDQLTTTQLVDM